MLINSLEKYISNRYTNQLMRTGLYSFFKPRQTHRSDKHEIYKLTTFFVVYLRTRGSNKNSELKDKKDLSEPRIQLDHLYLIYSMYKIKWFKDIQDKNWMNTEQLSVQKWGIFTSLTGTFPRGSGNTTEGRDRKKNSTIKADFDLS